MKRKIMKVIIGLGLILAAGAAVASTVVCTGCVSNGAGGWHCAECHVQSAPTQN